MKISWTLSTWNRRELTRQCFEANRASAGVAAEILWVDNGSTDGCAELGAGYRPDVLVLHRENRGHQRAMSTALALATGDWVAIIGSQSLMPPGWLRKMADIAATGEVDAVCINDCRPEGERVTYPRSEIVLAGIPCVRSLCFANQLLRRDLLDSAGYIHEELGLYAWGDVEYAHRFAQRQHRAVMLRDEWSTHLGHAHNEYVMESHHGVLPYAEFKRREVADPAKAALTQRQAAAGCPTFNPFTPVKPFPVPLKVWGEY